MRIIFFIGIGAAVNTKREFFLYSYAFVFQKFLSFIFKNALNFPNLFIFNVIPLINTKLTLIKAYENVESINISKINHTSLIYSQTTIFISFS